jgi:hypothetical protein
MPIELTVNCQKCQQQKNKTENDPPVPTKQESSPTSSSTSSNIRKRSPLKEELEENTKINHSTVSIMTQLEVDGLNNDISNFEYAQSTNQNCQFQENTSKQEHQLNNSTTNPTMSRMTQAEVDGLDDDIINLEIARATNQNRPNRNSWPPNSFSSSPMQSYPPVQSRRHSTPHSEFFHLHQSTIELGQNTHLHVF